jgi:hypothetical protein
MPMRITAFEKKPAEIRQHAVTRHKTALNIPARTISLIP